MTTISPEAFLAQVEPDEDLEDDDQPTSALDSIAASLRTLAEAAQAPQFEAVLDSTFVAANPLAEKLQLLTETHADLQDEHLVLLTLLEEVEAIVKPSTSKLANSVRAAIEGWRNPEVPADPDLPSLADMDELNEPQVPAHDAPIEEWLEYAKARGLDVDPGRTNRSQIRTMLGIPHGVDEA